MTIHGTRAYKDTLGKIHCITLKINFHYDAIYWKVTPIYQ